MQKSPSIIAVVFAGLLLSGCVSSPSSSVNAPPSTSQGIATPPAPASPEQIQDLQAELRQLGPMDSMTQDRLLEDLRQSDPALWPLVIEQFRSAQAYRQQAMHRIGLPEFVRRLPTTNEPTDTSGGTAGLPSSVEPTVGQANRATQPPPPSTDVVPSSYTDSTTGVWRQRLNEAIESLETEASPNATTPAELALHARLRMLYAAAGRREDAATPIPYASPAEQQFLSKELEGLGAWLDADKVPDPVCRAAEAKPALIEALAGLAATAPLLVRNAAFCTEVLSFGCVKRFNKYEFFPDQEVLLYAELENFVSEPTAKGFRTSLQSAYEILDDLGRQMVRRDFASTEEHCKSARRDFFVGYHLRMPRQIAPGKYMLRLAIRDMISQKTGQASIEFVVKEGKAEPKPKSEKEAKI